MKAYRALVLLTGAGVLAYGLHGLLNDPQIAEPSDVLAWALAAVVLHDGIWLPLACLAGALLARDAVLRSGLIVAASVTAVALPAVLREDADHGNPTLLPLPYQRNLLLLLGGCALVTGTVWAVRRLRERRTGRPGGVRRRRRP